MTSLRDVVSPPCNPRSSHAFIDGQRFIAILRGKLTHLEPIGCEQSSPYWVHAPCPL
ncbi:hypothetical protein ORQ98_29200 [Spartinivicinus sp. A2-2]|uniref:Uncharacterized protein n=1 Tax=Spartinivicinus poritis TaxID=2994640 RepID=A0ABT5UIB3_9GAMM|nr:hypothetical protein [Spartinivicinus sp. A2-2]